MCDLCLWYADDGRRLCQRHAGAHEAAGGTVISPDNYDTALQPQSLNGAPPAENKGEYRGNSMDLSAYTAMLVGLVTLLSCIGGSYFLPLVAGILGLIAFLNAQNSVDAGRTRTFGILGMAGGLLGIVPIAIFFCFFLFMMGMVFSGGGFTGGP